MLYRKFIAIASISFLFYLIPIMGYFGRKLCEYRIITMQTKRQLILFNENIKNNFTSKRRKVLTKSIYPIVLSRPYNINNEGICRNVQDLSCIVMVHTSPNHFERRKVMRQTWLNSTFYYPESIRVVFLIGLVSNSTLQSEIEHESSNFKDIVQGHFIDSYHNLTNKGVMGLKWISEYCQNAMFTIKIDDDVFINFFKVFQEMPEIRRNKKLIICNRMDQGTNYIQRDKFNKWYVQRNEFKLMKFYPYTSCSGLAVFMSRDLVPILYKSAMISPFFWVDDFYLFGILPAKIPGVKHHGINANVTLEHSEALKCYNEKGSQCPLVVSSINPEKDNVTMRLWRKLLE